MSWLAGWNLGRYRWLAAVAIAAALPLALRSNYALHMAVAIGINSIVALGLNLLIGYAGQVSLGQAAFIAIGSYSSAVLSVKLGLSPWLGMLVGMAVCAAVAFIIGGPLLRLRGHYLAMGTLGFGVIAQVIMVQWEGLTGGTVGISGVPQLALAGFALKEELAMYYLVAAIVLSALALATNIINSRVGRAMRAVHGSEVAAATSGVDTARYKLQVFVLSAVLAALAGSLYAHHTGYVGYDSFGFGRSIQLVVMVVIGGMASIWGAILGAAAVTLIVEHLRSFQEYSTIIFGGVLMVIMIFLPAGLWRGVLDILRRLSRTGRRPRAERV